MEQPLGGSHLVRRRHDTSQPRAWCRGGIGQHVMGVCACAAPSHCNRAVMSLDTQLTLDARRRTRRRARAARERPAHARRRRRRSVGTTTRSRLVARSASSALIPPSRRCDPRHVRRRLRQPRDAAGARPLGRRVVLAARAPAAALARLSDRRSACARPLGRAPPPLWPRKRDCALPAGLCQQGSSGALGRRLEGKRPPSLGGCDVSLAS